MMQCGDSLVYVYARHCFIRDILNLCVLFLILSFDFDFVFCYGCGYSQGTHQCPSDVRTVNPLTSAGVRWAAHHSRQDLWHSGYYTRTLFFHSLVLDRSPGKAKWISISLFFTMSKSPCRPRLPFLQAIIRITTHSLSFTDRLLYSPVYKCER